MAIPSFDEIIKYCETVATDWLVDTRKQLPQTWLLFFDDDRPPEIDICHFDSPISKKLAQATMRQRISNPQVVAYAMVDEAWLAERPLGSVTPDGVPIDGVMPRDDPHRKEVVICYASTLSERAQRCWDIVRDYKGTIRLLRPVPDWSYRGPIDDPHLAGTIPNMFRDAGRLS